MKSKKFEFNSILKGNCIEKMKDLPKKSFQLILTDPPYNVSGKSKLDLKNNTTGGPWYKMEESWDIFKDYKEYLDFTRFWTREADKLLVDSGSMMICCSYHGLGEILIALKELDYKILNIIIWKKSNPMPNVTKRTLTHSTEYVVWAAKSKGWTFNYTDMKKYANGKQLRDVWEFALCQGPQRIKNESGRAAHPNQKPLEFMKRLVEMATKKGDTVLDPFIGVGSTAVAADQLKRKWVGIESNSEYVKIAKKRINNIEE
jgi:site-specific DNA-methyltransferase (adenine-specific)